MGRGRMPAGAARPALRALLSALVVQACTTENVTEVVVVSVTVQPGTAAVEAGSTVEFAAVVADEAGATQVGALVVWSSSTPDVVSVDHGGVARALTTGLATVEATFQDITGSATVVVIPRPTLLLDPTAVSMAADVRGERPTPATVRIANGGLGRLTELASRVQYEPGAEQGWLGADLSGDATPATLALTADIQGMAAGSYDAVVVVTSGDLGDPGTSLPVRLSLAGITVRHTGGGTSVEESGATDTLSVVLDLAPGADVRLSVTPADPDQITVSPPLLTFTTTSWSTPQIVTVTAVDDRVVDEDRSTEATVSVDAAEGTPYVVVDDRLVGVTVIDDDVAGFLLTETGGRTWATEGSYTDTLIVVLTAEPRGEVVLSAWTDDPDDATLEPDRLTFTPLTWDDPQILIFTAVDDDRRDGFGFRTLTIATDPSRSDPAFHGLSRTLDAITFDNDRVRDSEPGS